MSVSQRSNGKWEVRYRDKSGAQRSKSFTLKKDAQKYEREILSAMVKGDWTNPELGRKTVNQVNDEFMLSQYHLKPKSREAMESLWRFHIEPKFGKTKIIDLDSSSIRVWLTNAVVGENAYTTSGRIKKALVQFSRILDFAVDNNYIPKNPARGSNGKVLKVSLPQTESTRVSCSLDREELLKLARTCTGFEGLILLAGIMGLRWAEIVGLQVQDLNIPSRNLVVRRTLSELSGAFYESTTKTGASRSLVIPEFLVPYLEVQIKGKSSSDLVFTSSTGTPLRNSNFRQRHYDPAVKASGVPPVNLHDLRHTAASIALQGGAKLLQISEMLGHADKALTLRRYSHLLEDDKQGIAVILDDIYAESQN